MKMRKTNNVNRLMVLAGVFYCASLPAFATSTVPESMASVVQQTTKLRGTVLDAKTGEPIIGANVLIKGTAIGTITNFDGEYEFEGTVGAKLVISFVG